MKVSYSWLQTYFAKGFFKKGLPKPEKLAALFNDHAFEVEGIEKIASGDSILDIKILPDRAHYALSHRGIAREASVLAQVPLKAHNATDVAAAAVDPSIAAPQVHVTDAKLCPRYMLRAIRDVAVGDSPAWLRGRLEAVGARSINTIVDATNFVMLDLGQPLHAFDADKVRGAITVRLAKAGEKIIILDGREIELRDTDLVIADESGPLAIAGVKGGKRAEVTTSTRNILIESANFNPTSVRKTSTRTNLRNDSSKRFENEITPALAAEAMTAVTELILNLSKEAKAAAPKVSAVTDAYPSPAHPWTVETSAVFISAVIGETVSAKDIKAILEREGCKVIAAGADSSKDPSTAISITPPLDRLDLRIPEDIADEIARIRGYAKLPARQTPHLDQPVPVDRTFYYAEQVKNALTELGFSEASTYSLVPKGAFEIAYPLASDKAALRERIAPKLSESLVANGRNADLLGLDAIRIFEIGSVFPKTGEKASLAVGILPIQKKKGITAESLLKDAVAALEAKLGSPIEGKIEVGPYGAILEVDFSALVSKLPAPKSLADLAFKALPQDKKYAPFSHYPFIVRDIALFVPVGIGEAKVVSVIIAALSGSAGKLLVKGPDLFDTFEKDGKVSYAFRMIFQSFDRTLSDEEANGFMTQVYSAVKAHTWEVR